MSVLQLLDCFVIPVLMLLSRLFLKTRYRLVHFVAVAVCLLGVGAMVGADILAGRNEGSGKMLPQTCGSSKRCRGKKLRRVS